MARRPSRPRRPISAPPFACFFVLVPSAVFVGHVLGCGPAGGDEQRARRRGQEGVESIRAQPRNYPDTSLVRLCPSTSEAEASGAPPFTIFSVPSRPPSCVQQYRWELFNICRFTLSGASAPPPSSYFSPSRSAPRPRPHVSPVRGKNRTHTQNYKVAVATGREQRCPPSPGAGRRCGPPSRAWAA